MQFMLSVHHGDHNTVPADVTVEQIFADVDAFNQSLVTEDRLVFAGGLKPSTAATIVDATSEHATMHRGSYLPGPEHLGGFWVVRADDLDKALEIAKHASAACRQVVEVRPFQDDVE
ncbi:Uncharacterized conserved protein [Raineyella antarctica]|uniref:Uncharacterized conserved protein n=1 Tax=Raineyella antarctica TaxID=1577474 RepID=A0A1G6GFQ8_9ACTN|nr:YciI family protein [Raineyella antarctica]SDB80739.1 Uncharacterized conserved protein [Raineyella antarctica]